MIVEGTYIIIYEYTIMLKHISGTDILKHMSVCYRLKHIHGYI